MITRNLTVKQADQGFFLSTVGSKIFLKNQALNDDGKQQRQAIFPSLNMSEKCNRQDKRLGIGPFTKNVRN